MRRVDLSVSKLLKKLGYNFPSLVITNEEGNVIIDPYKTIESELQLFDYDINYYDDVFLLPTLYEVVEWLIIYHNTVVSVNVSFIPDKIAYLNELERLVGVEVRRIFLEMAMPANRDDDQI